MKSFDEINKEIDEQITNLNKKGVETSVLVLGDLSYATLKRGAKEMQIHIPNEGFVLRKYKGLRVIVDPSYAEAGIFKKENDAVEVLGK